MLLNYSMFPCVILAHDWPTMYYQLLGSVVTVLAHFLALLLLDRIPIVIFVLLHGINNIGSKLYSIQCRV